MKPKIAHVHEIATAHAHARTHAQCTNTLCITQLHNVHKVEDGACGNKAQAVDPIEQKSTGAHVLDPIEQTWGNLNCTSTQLHTAVEDPIEET